MLGGLVCCATCAVGTGTVLVFVRTYLAMVDLVPLLLAILVTVVAGEKGKVTYDGYSGRVFSIIDISCPVLS